MKKKYIYINVIMIFSVWWKCGNIITNEGRIKEKRNYFLFFWKLPKKTCNHTWTVIPLCILLQCPPASPYSPLRPPPPLTLGSPTSPPNHGCEQYGIKDELNARGRGSITNIFPNLQDVQNSWLDLYWHIYFIPFNLIHLDIFIYWNFQKKIDWGFRHILYC